MGVVGLSCYTCCSTCDIGSDTFPTDGSGVPTGWTLRTGAFDVVGGVLDSTTSNSLALFSTAHPDGIASAVVTVEVYFAADEEGTIVFNHSGSSDAAYHFVKVTPYEMSLWSRSGSTDTLLKCISCDLTGNPSSVTAYFDGQTTGTFAAVSGAAYVYYNVGTGHTGAYVGLGTKTIASEMAFDNFDFNKYEQSGNGCASYTPDDCELGADNFNRSDNVDPGCSWTEVSGTSEINTNRLKFTANNSLAKFNASNPASGAMVVEVDVRKGSVAAVPEVGVNYVSTSSYHYCRILNSGANNYLSLGSIAGGTLLDSGTFTMTNDYTYHLVVMLSNGRLCAHLYDGATLIKGINVGVTIPLAERWATLGCRIVSTNVQFDNFVLSKGVEADPETETCETCPVFGPNCADDCCPETHTQMIVNVGISLTDKATCTWCSQIDGEFTATGGPCGYSYCQHPIDDDTPCSCVEYSCDSDCADGGFDIIGPDTQGCHPGDSTATYFRCNGVSIGVSIIVDDNNLCYLKVLLSVINAPSPTTETPCSIGLEQVMAEAMYESADGADIRPCSGITYTLTRYDGALSTSGSYRNACWAPPYTGGCNGSFPATITVRSAP